MRSFRKEKSWLKNPPKSSKYDCGRGEVSNPVVNDASVLYVELGVKKGIA